MPDIMFETAEVTVGEERLLTVYAILTPDPEQAVGTIVASAHVTGKWMNLTEWLWSDPAEHRRLRRDALARLADTLDALQKTVQAEREHLARLERAERGAAR